MLLVFSRALENLRGPPCNHPGGHASRLGNYPPRRTCRNPASRSPRPSTHNRFRAEAKASKLSSVISLRAPNLTPCVEQGSSRTECQGQRTEIPKGIHANSHQTDVDPKGGKNKSMYLVWAHNNLQRSQKGSTSDVVASKRGKSKPMWAPEGPK